MSFQQKVGAVQGFGVAGDIHLESPNRVESLIVNSEAQKNIVGHAFTKDSSTNVAKVGGVVGSGRVFAGLLVNSKQYALYGTEDGTLAPSLAIPNNSNGDFLTMGDIVIKVKSSCKIGDFVVYDETTGELSTVSDKSSLGGKQLVPNAVIYRFPVTSGHGGLTVARLTN